jgi:RimJ/RimL family protein N-acetyltransferase
MNLAGPPRPRERRRTRCAAIGQDARVMIGLPDTLEGDGVRLRRLREDDAPAYAAAFREDPELGRLIGAETDPDEAKVRERAGQGFELVVAGPGDTYAGSVLLHSLDERNRHCEVGFWLVPAARGQGLASRAVRLVVSWAFEALGVLRVEMTTTPDNAAVFALAERLGFTHEGVLRKRNIERGERVDVAWFGVLREDWRSQR